MSDLISRQAAIEDIRTMIPKDARLDIKWIEMWLMQLPPAQPDPNCSEIPNNSDTISRQAAIDALDKRFDNVPMGQTAEILKLRKDLRELPSVQQERKTGRWVERNPQNSPDCRLIECSECGNAYIVGYDIDYDDWIDGRDFCMRCGADLRGGSNGKST